MWVGCGCEYMRLACGARVARVLSECGRIPAACVPTGVLLSLTPMQTAWATIATTTAGSASARMRMYDAARGVRSAADGARPQYAAARGVAKPKHAPPMTTPQTAAMMAEPAAMRAAPASSRAACAVAT